MSNVAVPMPRRQESWRGSKSTSFRKNSGISDDVDEDAGKNSSNLSPDYSSTFIDKKGSLSNKVCMPS